MDFNNKTILISGLVIASICAMYWSYQDIALAIVSGLVGYLSKDVVSVESVEPASSDESVSVEPTTSEDVVSVDEESNIVEENEDIA